jgi:hypothetical protein
MAKHPCTCHLCASQNLDVLISTPLLAQGNTLGIFPQRRISCFWVLTRDIYLLWLKFQCVAVALQMSSLYAGSMEWTRWELPPAVGGECGTIYPPSVRLGNHRVPDPGSSGILMTRSGPVCLTVYRDFDIMISTTFQKSDRDMHASGSRVCASGNFASHDCMFLLILGLEPPPKTMSRWKF